MYNIVKRQISLEKSTDRTFNYLDPTEVNPNWGKMTAETFYVNIFLTQSMDDMGIFYDIEYLPQHVSNNKPDYTILTEKLLAIDADITFPFMSAATQPLITGTTATEEKLLRRAGSVESYFYNYLNSRISGYTDSKLEELRTYDANNPFRIGFDVEREDYVNYANVKVSGSSRIKSMGNPRNYFIDTDIREISAATQNTGIIYNDFTGQSRSVLIDNTVKIIPLTRFDYIGEGFNATNTSLSATTKQEYLFGIISPPEVTSDVFIDRGITSVTDRHLKLSEVKNLGQLSRYGNGFYTINKQ